MNRAYCFALLLAFSFSIPVTAGDKEKVSDKIAAAIENKTQPSSSQGDGSVSNAIADRVRANENNSDSDSDSSSRRERFDNRRESYHYTGYDLNVASCPFGTSTPEFDSLRYKYRDLTDAELWKICLNRNKMTLEGTSGACACSLLASPDPWRPVDTPHMLEHADEPIADPEPGISEK